LLMLLPQSTAFFSLRNRLNAVNSAGFLHIAPKSAIATMSTRSKIGRDEIKWQELLMHFRSIQAKHEKARRQALGTDSLPFTDFPENDKIIDSSGERIGRPISTNRPPMRRRVTGDLGVSTGAPLPPGPTQRSGALSPLNPRARVQNPTSSVASTSLNPTALLRQQAQNQRRAVDLGKK